VLKLLESLMIPKKAKCITEKVHGLKLSTLRMWIKRVKMCLKVGTKRTIIPRQTEVEVKEAADQSTKEIRNKEIKNQCIES
jgi:hypothetical protein